MPVLQVDGRTDAQAQLRLRHPARPRARHRRRQRSTARPFSEPRGRRAPIDMFFRSVAASRGDGIGVILSGAGADGALGVRAIKEAGGVIMVQEPAEAGFASMPQNAIATGVADFVAPLARLAERLAEVARSKEAVRSLDADGSANDLRRIVAFLRARTGHDFSSYKRATVMRRVIRRMQVCRTDTLAGYADYSADDARGDQGAVLGPADLRDDVLPRPACLRGAGAQRDQAASSTISRPEASDGMRAWVVGCATGEEAYSIAILLQEEAARRKLNPSSKSSRPTSTRARSRRRGKGAIRVRSRPTSRRSGWPASSSTRARIIACARKCAKACCSPSHSVIKDPPFLRLDLITCRNLLIYLERSLQQQLCSIFHYGLKPGRFLFLGSAETADAATDLFAPTRPGRADLLRPRSCVGRAVPALPHSPSPERVASADTRRRGPIAGRASDMPAALHAAALERSRAAERAGRRPRRTSCTSRRAPDASSCISAGPISNLLPAVVRPELRLDLRLALTRALDRRAADVDASGRGGVREAKAAHRHARHAGPELLKTSARKRSSFPRRRRRSARAPAEDDPRRAVPKKCAACTPN